MGVLIHIMLTLSFYGIYGYNVASSESLAKSFLILLMYGDFPYTIVMRNSDNAYLALRA